MLSLKRRGLALKKSVNPTARDLSTNPGGRIGRKAKNEEKVMKNEAKKVKDQPSWSKK